MDPKSLIEILTIVCISLAAICFVIYIVQYFQTKSTSGRNSCGQKSPKENLGYRYLREPSKNPLGTDSDTIQPVPYSPGNSFKELPVGGGKPQAVGTTTWFSKGGRVGGMDIVDENTNHDRPEQFDLYGPLPANETIVTRRAMKAHPLEDEVGPQMSADGPPMSEESLLPGSDSLLDVIGDSRAMMPQVSTMAGVNQDLSGRPVDFPNTPAESYWNSSSNLTPESDTESELAGPIPASASGIGGSTLRSSAL